MSSIYSTIKNNIFNKPIIEYGTCLGGLGWDCSDNTETITNIKNSQNIITKNDLEITNKQINNLVVNETIKTAQKCSASAGTQQNVNMAGTEDIFMEGDITQDSSVKVDLRCVQANEVKSTVHANLISSMMADLKTDTNQELYSRLASMAKTDQTSGFLSGIGSNQQNSSTTTNITNEYNALSETKKKIALVFENAITKNFNSFNLQECINSATSSQLVNIAGRNIYMKGNISQKAAIESLSNCSQLNNLSTGIVMDVANNFGLKVADKSTQKASTDISAESTTSQVKKGPLDIITDIINAIFAGFGSAGSIISIILIVLIVVGGIAFFLLRSGGDGDSSGGIEGMVEDINQSMMEGGFLKFFAKKSPVNMFTTDSFPTLSNFKY